MCLNSSVIRVGGGKLALVFKNGNTLNISVKNNPNA